MQKIILPLTLIFASLSGGQFEFQVNETHAKDRQPSQTTSNSSQCPKCDRIKGINLKLSELSIDKEKDVDTGVTLTLEAIDELAEIFDPSIKKPKVTDELVEEMTKLAWWSVPFDSEASIADLLTATIEIDPKNEKIYLQTLNSLPNRSQKDKCRREEVSSSVEENLCFIKAPGKKGSKQNDAAVSKCIRSFDFEACAKRAK